ncbi:hypothetical protein CAAN1_04S03004 [[Candida] anglica]|uniref:Uncharacterized protein n=1 Tax=[Candida] anglica TaxID=148631 RepID=A0ABP0EA69_9ASCO
MIVLPLCQLFPPSYAYARQALRINGSIYVLGYLSHIPVVASVASILIRCVA